MKKLLPILLCYILMTSQVFAISGGPVFGGGQTNAVGTYSGVLVSTDPTNPGLGLFDLSVPATSVATGAFLLYAALDGGSSDGIFTGNLDASVDPSTNKLSGIAFGFQFQQENSETGGTVAVETAYATGLVQAQISGLGRLASSARLTGTAVLTTVDIVSRQSSKLMFTVTGFQQSTTASTVSALPTLTNNG